MNITWESFLRNIQAIRQLSADIYDNWKICHQPCFYSEMNAYLTKQECKASRIDAHLLSFEYHVVYDAIYTVPKLCFNVFKTDGAVLQFQDCVKQLNFEENDSILEILTQMDHPVLQKPFYCLHPCKTAELMETIAGKSNNVVVTWLSTVGPSVGLCLDNVYSKLT